MIITLDNISKEFGKNILFSNLSYTFEEGNKYAVLGPEDSGKSTLLQIIAGKESQTSGKIIYLEKDKEISEDKLSRKISIASPYIHLVEEFTFSEMVDFHFKLKKTAGNISQSKLHGIINLPSIFGKKKIAHYSPSIKQRIKLLLTIFSNVKVILLDEPTYNLDSEGIKWFQQLIEDYSGNRTIIICSNSKEEETCLCNYQLKIEDFK
jgi:ABC-type multidrug transport system ATPase subunit